MIKTTTISLEQLKQLKKEQDQEKSGWLRSILSFCIFCISVCLELVRSMSE